ncbi:SGNH/GDSL hydrolase family protein [Aspergillus alliaceus]|uniref:SGNH/GDSL hydrolase family protein n=1 Tax=Petromyces alliaceus TaxID=209559 RepID=UPI0012A40F1C|nr:SGNH hydrolase-type esterase domain-containing protein [Aspergillus alliaceus]KAB8237503.1 SGNH hydrolase-type esterase domain-containing protein [Aspergillus alliaceus]
MPQLTEPANLPPPPYNSSTSIFQNTTIRQTIRVTQPGDEIRVRLSNAFGLDDLSITKVAVSLSAGQKLGTSIVQPNTTKEVAFSERPDAIIPNGGLVVSDPINLSVKAQDTLTIDIYLQHGQSGGAITSHPGSRTTSWMSFGNWVGRTNFTDSSVNSVDHWYFISAIEALLPPTARSCALVGDSITDGRGSDTNKNNRWPDLLLAKMQQNPKTTSIALLNQAAGGNRILADGLGPNVLARLDRDVLAQSGVQYAIVFEGVNDIGVADTDPASQEKIGDKLIASYQQIVTRLHAAQIPVFGATITPFGAPGNASNTQPYSDPEREKTRQRINEWIRTNGLFDAVLDFDRVLRDPEAPSRLKSEYNSGDYLHPNAAGYQALADYFPLGLFEEFGRLN